MEDTIMSNWSGTNISASNNSPIFCSALPGSREGLTELPRRNPGRLIVGVLEGEGVGPDLISVVLDLLQLAGRRWQLDFDIRFGSAIGTIAEEKHGAALTDEVMKFCESIFSEGGAILCGPGGSRFVYDLRARFDLFCKFTPVRPMPSLEDAGVLKAAAIDGVDLVVVRENVSGLYFNEGHLSESEATHTFCYSSKDVRRIIMVAIRLAQQRRQRLTLAVKPAAIKAVSQLWMNVFEELTADQGLVTSVLEIDNASYQIIAAANSFDVVVAPNMFGDILSDCAALLLSSRGMSYSGNFSSSGDAVYQTGHGAAYDLAGKNIANPIGQILSATFMLRESFGLHEPAAAIEAAVQQTLAAGIRTADIAAPGCRVVSTQDMGRYIASALEEEAAQVSSK